MLEAQAVLKEPIVRVQTLKSRRRPGSLAPVASVRTISFDLKRKPVKRRYWTPFKPKSFFCTLKRVRTKISLNSMQSGLSMLTSPTATPVERRQQSVSPLRDYRRKGKEYSYFTWRTSSTRRHSTALSPLALSGSSKRLTPTRASGNRSTGSDLRTSQHRMIRVKTDTAINTEPYSLS